MLETYLQDVLRKSGYGIYVGNIFTGCILYADDIFCGHAVTMGCKKMVNICTAYGIQWNIKFNSMKSQCITFGGSHSSDLTVLLTGSTVQLVDKIKYLGCYFNQDCTIYRLQHGYSKVLW